MVEKDISDMDYKAAGVDLIAQNEVNARIKQELQELGLNAEGLFGGAVDITHFKGEDSVPIGVICSSLLRGETLQEIGENATKLAIRQMNEGTVPIALLDYFASPGMDEEEVPEFVKGIAIQGLEHRIPLIGGESAQMPGTYKPGQRDAFVHLLYHGNQGTTVDLVKLIKDMERPLLCGSTDGTGTKTRIVKHPKDIIYHSGNDLGAIGVRPVAFSLYVAGNVSKEELETIVRKSQQICDTLGIVALEPSIRVKPEEYVRGEVDIAGTVIGVIDEKDMITGVDVEKGDAIIGFGTNSLMTNGYSLARGYMEIIDHPSEKREKWAIRELSKPHTPYTDILFGKGEELKGILSKYKGQIKATAHITGGGQSDNIRRMIPDGLGHIITRNTLPLPPIVKYFRHHTTDIDTVMKNMYETFNMGIGFTITVPQEIASDVVEYVNDNFRRSVRGVDRQAAIIGYIRTRFEFVD